mmetsp:Transcript_131561/g.294391  ORF Transcript_131561/g.294391 Transcript_131561/m.294391 type:complete len:219 (+) Transcript_131561:85-741(+)
MILARVEYCWPGSSWTGSRQSSMQSTRSTRPWGQSVSAWTRKTSFSARSTRRWPGSRCSCPKQSGPVCPMDPCSRSPGRTPARKASASCLPRRRSRSTISRSLSGHPPEMPSRLRSRLSRRRRISDAASPGSSRAPLSSSSWVVSFWPIPSSWHLRCSILAWIMVTTWTTKNFADQPVTSGQGRRMCSGHLRRCSLCSSLSNLRFASWSSAASSFWCR